MFFDENNSKMLLRYVPLFEGSTKILSGFDLHPGVLFLYSRIVLYPMGIQYTDKMKSMREDCQG
ncbi:hypothetical protein D7322_13285 [Sphingobacterium puteale]|uniref:Uncharacterized protein n=1 Tax=Sphingobacterium puteale TaxID=2420510 RepID=A0A420VY52_9SPHI|nr:hypothetical protein D7322_13285 [Sphingobacterium puteale]